MSLVAAIRERIRQRWSRWLDRRIPRRTEFTLDQKRIFIFLSRQGLLTFAVLCALFIAGLNYANNLLLGLCFLLGSLMIVTIHHTFANLSGLRIVALGTEPAFAGDKAGFRIRLESSKGRIYEGLRLVWDDAEAFVERIDNPREVGVYLKAPQRGMFRPPRLKIVTVYPLGLLQSWTWLDLDLAAVVYPRPLENHVMPVGAGREGEGEVERLSGTEDFEGLRQFSPGDPLSHISWRHMAQGRGILTKLYADEIAGTDILDWQYFAGMDVEGRLSRLAWWVVKLAREDVVYGLRLPGVDIPLGRGPQHRDNCLKALALYEWKP